MKNKEIKPEGSRSLWVETTQKTNFPSLENDIEVDVAVVGAGIAGVTTAYLLQKAGKNVVILEMNRIVEGVTGFTTAKITALHSLKYTQLIRNFGKEGAKNYAEANTAGLEKIAEIVKTEKINCDFERAKAISYTEEDRWLKNIKQEVESAKAAGLPAYFTDKTELPFDIKGAVVLENQAHFHPRKYLLELSKIFIQLGGKVYENSRVVELNEVNGGVELLTEKGKIKAKNAVLATNFPIKDTGRFYSRLFPYYSYALALKIKGKVPEEMYWAPDDIHRSIRSQKIGKETLLIAGGGNHKSGQGGDTIRRYEEVLDYVRSRFEVEEVVYHWSTMDYRSPDGVPFIGLPPKLENTYITTGFGAWGMTNGTVSAMIISDLILGKKNKWADFFSARRKDKIGSSKDFLLENIKVGGQYANKYLKRKKRNPEELEVGEGGVFKFNGEEKAYYKDEKGNLHAVSSNCTHLGCVVNWNNADATWDCPCHGSKFSKEGRVLHGPALKDLEQK